MSANKKLKTDGTPHKRLSAPNYQSANDVAPERTITLLTSQPSNGSQKIYDNNNKIPGSQVFFPDTRLVQSIAESVRDGNGRCNSKGLKEYGPFYLEIPYPDKTEDNNKIDHSKESTGTPELFKDEQNWIKDMERLLTCLGCRERLHPPVSACDNSHYVCNYCMQAKNHKCPSCGEKVSYLNQLMVNSMVAIFMFHCKYSQSGCQFKAVPKDLVIHEKSCNYQDIRCILFKSGEFCNDVISLHDYLKHIHNHHKHSIRHQFKMNKVNEMTLPRKVNLERNHFYFRVLKDDENSVCFIESTYYDDATRTYQIAVHYVGKKSEAGNYIYTIDILKGEYFKEYRYSNECLPAMHAMDAEKFHPFILQDRNNCFSIHRTLRYNLTITKKILFDTFSSLQVVKPEILVCSEK